MQVKHYPGIVFSAVMIAACSPSDENKRMQENKGLSDTVNSEMSANDSIENALRKAENIVTSKEDSIARFDSLHRSEAY